VSPKFSISAENVVSQFHNNEIEATEKYSNTVIEVYGRVKKISHLNNRRTIILEGNSSSAIICDLDDSEQINIDTLKINQQLYIKGVCKGYLKDIVLLNCFIKTE